MGWRSPVYSTASPSSKKPCVQSQDATRGAPKARDEMGEVQRRSRRDVD